MENLKTIKEDEFFTLEQFDFLSLDAKSRVASYVFLPKCKKLFSDIMKLSRHLHIFKALLPQSLIDHYCDGI